MRELKPAVKKYNNKVKSKTMTIQEILDEYDRLRVENGGRLIYKWNPGKRKSNWR